MRGALVRLSVAAALLCLPVPSGAWLIQGGGPPDTGKQVLISNSTAALSNAADRTIGLGATGAAQASGFNSLVFPVAGTIKSMKFTALTQPSGAATWTGTVVLNGSSSAASCTVTSSTAICDWTGSVSVSAGDVANILVHPSGAPTSSIVSASVGFTPTTLNDTIMGAGADGATFSTSATNTVPGFFLGTPAALGPTGRLAVLPDGGTVDRLFVASVAPGAAASGKSYEYEVLKSGAVGSPQRLRATISETATATNDTSNSISFSAGDYLNFQGAPTSTPTASDAGFGARFLASTTGAYAFINSTGGGPSNAAVRYFTITGGQPATTESTVNSVTHSQTFTKIRAKVVTAPGTAASGKKWDVTLRKNGADTALTCQILETATTCSGTGSVAVNDNDLISISTTPTSSPTGTGGIGISLLAAR